MSEECDYFPYDEKFWTGMNVISEMETQLKRFDQSIQMWVDGQEVPILVTIKDGKVTTSKGETSPDIYQVLNLETNRKALKELYSGRKSFADLVIEEQLFAHEMSKRATITWVGNLIRLRQKRNFEYEVK